MDREIRLSARTCATARSWCGADEDGGSSGPQGMASEDCSRRGSAGCLPPVPAAMRRPVGTREHLSARRLAYDSGGAKAYVSLSSEARSREWLAEQAVGPLGEVGVAPTPHDFFGMELEHLSLMSS